MSRLRKGLLLFILLFALQISGTAPVGVKKHPDTRSEAAVKQAAHHDQLIAENGEAIHLPALQLKPSSAAFFTVYLPLQPFATNAPYIGERSNITPSRFYRLILFPFHGFW